MLTRNHIESVRNKFPNLKTTVETWWFVIWEGYIIGLDQPYKIRIVWTRYSPWNKFQVKNCEPRVYVISPPLLDREDSCIPHVYDRGEKQHLCLYDPKIEDWENDEKSIADTLIPWASEWLATYELWRVTGKWMAPERHPEKEIEKTTGDSKKNNGTNINNEFVKVMGTYSSCALMVAASCGEYFFLSKSYWKKYTGFNALLSQLFPFPINQHHQSKLQLQLQKKEACLI